VSSARAPSKNGRAPQPVSARARGAGTRDAPDAFPVAAHRSTRVPARPGACNAVAQGSKGAAAADAQGVRAGGRARTFATGRNYMARLDSPFLTPNGAKGSAFEVSIGSLDEPEKTVSAQYRPKELDVSQNVPWTKHTNKSPEGSLQLEFSGADGRDASLELFFDASETKGGSVQDPIDMLTDLAMVRDPYSLEDKKKRPHHCVMVFGNIYRKKMFKCVIQSIATKFTMFSPDGDPIRATVTVKLKETHLVDMTAEQKNDAAKAKKG
jgi:hypothetical protein